VGTATFWDPRSPVRVAQELDRFLREQGVGNVGEIVGTLKWPGARQ
jgi:dihydroorotate dehydrogenase